MKKIRVKLKDIVHFDSGDDVKISRCAHFTSIWVHSYGPSLYFSVWLMRSDEKAEIVTGRERAA